MNQFKNWLLKHFHVIKPAPSEFSFVQQLLISLGTTIIFCALYFTNAFLGKDNLLLLSPFAISALTIFTMPSDRMGSLSVVFKSYFLCTFLGFIFAFNMNNQQWIFITAGIASFIILTLFDCMHPPAVMLPMIMIKDRLNDFNLTFNPIAIDLIILISLSYLIGKSIRKFPTRSE